MGARVKRETEKVPKRKTRLSIDVFNNDATITSYLTLSLSDHLSVPCRTSSDTWQ